MSPRQISRWEGLTTSQLQRRWRGHQVCIYGRVGSTNTVAASLAEGGVPAGTIVLAREQTTGRGRGDNVWHSPAGRGLYLSMVFRPAGVENPALLSILAGLGVTRELDVAFPGLAPRLKWPNDIMVGHAKLGGILCEASSEGDAIRHLVIGIGINVKRFEVPRKLRGGVAFLTEAAGVEAELVSVADAAIRGLESETANPPPVLDSARLDQVDRYDWLRDRRVRLHLPHFEDVISGVAVGIAPDGALLFRPDRGALRRVKVGHLEIDAPEQVREAES